MKTISFIIPVYNEQDSIDTFLDEIKKIYALLQKASYQFEYIFVDDGSHDATREILVQRSAADPHIKLLSFSRNFGKESATFAGIAHADGDACIPIDVDLQDDISIIPEMIEKWEAGNLVVLAQRKKRKDNPIKKITSSFFYSIFNMVSLVDIPKNSGDFRLLDKKVYKTVASMTESNLFMRGLMAWPGAKTATVEFERKQRAKGTTKYNLWKSWNYAWDGFTSFSTVPLRFWSYLGLIIASFSFVYGIFIITKTFVTGVQTPGFASTIVIVLFLGGIQLMSIGIMGEYIGRIYLETKKDLDTSSREVMDLKNPNQKNSRFTMHTLIATFWNVIYKSPLGGIGKQLYYHTNLLIHGEKDPNEYIVDKEKELIFLVLSKNATTSIKRAFLSEKEKQKYRDSYAIHRTGILRRRKRIPKGCEHFYSFTIIRNPIKRLASLYESKFHTDLQKGEGFYYAGDPKFHQDMSFQEFADVVCKTPNHLSDRHFRSQAFCISKFPGQISHVGKVEDMPDAFEPLIQRGLAPLERSNKSKKKPMQDYYDLKLLDAVYERYQDDIQLGGYQSFYDELRRDLIEKN